MNLTCRILGHNPDEIDTITRTGFCRRCGAWLEFAYDMSMGGTIINKITYERHIALKMAAYDPRGRKS